MKFQTALDAMKAGKKVKRVFWGGYWYWDNEKDDVVMHFSYGNEKNLRWTDDMYDALNSICADDWVIFEDNE